MRTRSKKPQNLVNICISWHIMNRKTICRNNTPSEGISTPAVPQCYWIKRRQSISACGMLTERCWCLHFDFHSVSMHFLPNYGQITGSDCGSTSYSSPSVPEFFTLAILLPWSWHGGATRGFCMFWKIVQAHCGALNWHFDSKQSWDLS